MDPSEKGPARFYALFKVHKKHEPGTVPPERPIISGSGSITENISHFVQHHIQSLSTQHPAWIQDTPHLLRDLNLLTDIPDDSILCTVDVSALYTNINREDGVEAVKKILETRSDKTIPSDFIVKLLDLVLKYNIFEFSDKLYIQRIGTAMGTRCAPNVADIFMSFIDTEIIRRSEKFGELLFYRRYLDDILMIFRGSNSNLHSFISDINNIHSSINFTLEHTRKPSSDPEDDCQCEARQSIPFLDTSLSLRNGRINSDLYRKPSDRVQYLLPSSTPAPHYYIPYSLASRTVCI